MIACLGHLKPALILNLLCKAPKPMPLGSLFSKPPFEWCYKWINKYTYSSNFEVTFRLKILLWLHSLHFNHLSSFYFPTKVLIFLFWSLQRYSLFMQASAISQQNLKILLLSSNCLIFCMQQFLCRAMFMYFTRKI